MQRKATKNTRSANRAEKSFHSWLKIQPCVTCNNSAPSIVHHCEGATFKHNKVLVGHWFCIPLCQECDDVITNGSRRAFINKFGAQSYFWSGLIEIFNLENYELSLSDIECPQEVYDSIMDWGR